ncbi:MotY family protein [Vibrio alfacsensis]|uniref:MotY family protein n=1 Tax=Vibrio alfacsensis TaxID=1074311 RepID=UPI001BEDA26B|nr:OmpA family protein [Vibrio alfacsensis]BCN25735.1 sodium-type flagellar protein MotY [Vibrio alfacsensis]
MINYAFYRMTMAYLIKRSKSGLCKKYLIDCHARLTKVFVCFIFFTCSKLSMANELVTIPMDLSTWEYKSNHLECNLFHMETSYGKFYFRAEPSEKISFVADVQYDDNKWNRASLQSQSAPWNNVVATKHYDSQQLSRLEQRFEFQSGIDALLDDVSSGSWVTVSLSGSVPSSLAGITLPTIKTQSALSEFNACRERLPKLSFFQARDVVIPFQFGQKRLDASHMATLGALYSYVSVDPRVTKILIDGHTDNVGSDVSNLVVSRQRAEQVKQVLIRKGVDEQMIEVRGHGARYPIASNDTNEGQARNRRVTIRLVRDDERIVAKLNNEMKQDIQQNKAKVQ